MNEDEIAILRQRHGESPADPHAGTGDQRALHIARSCIAV